MESSLFYGDSRYFRAGKSRFVMKLITNMTEMMTPIPDEIVCSYGELQKDYEVMKSQGIVFMEGIPNIDEWSPKRRLVVIDDLMAETDSRFTQLFTKGSHHRDMSVIQIVQIFGKNEEQPTISLNAHYIIIFRNPRDQTQVIHLGKQIKVSPSL